LLSPYKVLTQNTVYHFEPADILEYTEVPRAKKESRGVKYGDESNTAPFTFELVSIKLKKVDPIMILSEATRQVHVSHWGFLSVDEYFYLENIGAELQGEFNRIDFTDMRTKNGKNCVRMLTAKYPWYI